MKSRTARGVLAASALVGALAACSATGTRASAGGTGGAGAGGDLGLAGGNQGGDPVTCGDLGSNKTYLGCDFWPTVVDNYVWSIFDYAVVVANGGEQAVDVTVTRKGAEVGSARVQPRSAATVYLPWVHPLKSKDAADVCGENASNTTTVRVNGGAYHLVASAPVAVYQFNAIEYKGAGGPPGKSWLGCPGDMCSGFLGCYSFSNDASLLLPTSAMTGTYRITGHEGWPEGATGPYFAVTGTQDGTTVNVKLGATGYILGGDGVPTVLGNGSTSFSLDAGDVVEVLGDPSSDFSGSLVEATKPVQVITGIACAQSPNGVEACDHLEESVFPAETLGRRYFVTVPTSPNGDVVGHLVRLYGNVDGTKLTYPSGPPPGAPASIDAGQVVDLGQVTQNFELAGDHELAVGSLQLGAALVDPSNKPPDQRGDPSQSQMTAVEQFRKRYVFLAPADYDVSYVDIVLPLGASVTVDGAPVGEGAMPISSGFGIARVKLGPGDGGAHVLTATEPVGIQVMGYGAYTSYQYPGGLDLYMIAPPPK